jgi:hypothetical protein
VSDAGGLDRQRQVEQCDTQREPRRRATASEWDDDPNAADTALGQLRPEFRGGRDIPQHADRAGTADREGHGLARHSGGFRHQN